MGFSFVSAKPTESLSELRQRLNLARKIQYSGWPPFLDMSGVKGWEPYAVSELFGGLGWTSELRWTTERNTLL